MRKDVEVRLGPGDRSRLEAVVFDRNSAQKHVWRAQIILATAEGGGTAEIMRPGRGFQACVWRWQRRFMEAGVDGLLHDKTRKPGKPRVQSSWSRNWFERTLGPRRARPPTGRAGRWPRPWAWRSAPCQSLARSWPCAAPAADLKLSRDPQFAAKVRDTSSAFTSTRRRTAWCCRSMRKETPP